MLNPNIKDELLETYNADISGIRDILLRRIKRGKNKVVRIIIGTLGSSWIKEQFLKRKELNKNVDKHRSNFDTGSNRRSCMGDTQNGLAEGSPSRFQRENQSR